MPAMYRVVTRAFRLVRGSLSLCRVPLKESAVKLPYWQPTRRLGSCAQTVFSHQLHRARLRPFLTHFLGIGHARTHEQARIGVVEHAIAMKINLLPVAGFEQPEFAQRVELHDGPNRLTFMMLHLSLQLANAVL